MKTINVTFEDSEIEKIEQAKEVWKVRSGVDDITWREFIMISAEEAVK